MPSDAECDESDALKSIHRQDLMAMATQSDPTPCIYIPLEIQEHIVTSGPPQGRDRVSFLCMCSLVCRDWLPISRSSLDLQITVDSIYSRDIFIALLQDPVETLTRAIRSLYVILNDDPSVFKPQGLYFPNLTELILEGVEFTSPHDLPELIKKCFPTLGHLTLEYSCFHYEHDESDDGLSDIPTFPIPIFTISCDGDEDVYILRTFYVIERLELNIYNSSTLATIAQCVRTQTLPNAHLALKIAVDVIGLNTNLGFPQLLALAGSLIMPYTLGNSILQIDILPHWIRLAPKLESLTFSFMAKHFKHLNFGPLMESLRAAKCFKALRLRTSEDYGPVPTMSAYIQGLSIFANAHFSIVVIERRASHGDILEEEVYRL